MEHIICEMCGSNEVHKENDVFICDICGTTFTQKKQEKIVERIIEKQVINQNDSEQVNRLLKLARTAKDGKNEEDALKYYKKVYELDPENWEGYYYSTFYTVIKNKKEFGHVSMQKCLEKIFPIIYKSEKDYRLIVKGMLDDTSKYTPQAAHNALEYRYNIGKIFVEVFKDDFEFCKKELVNYYDVAICICAEFYENIWGSSIFESSKMYDIILNMVQLMDKYRPGYEKHFLLEVKKKKIQKKIEEVNENINKETNRLKEEERKVINDKDQEYLKVKSAFGLLFGIISFAIFFFTCFFLSWLAFYLIDGVSSFGTSLFGAIFLIIILIVPYLKLDIKISPKIINKLAYKDYEKEIDKIKKGFTSPEDVEIIKRNKEEIKLLNDKINKIDIEIKNLNIENKIKNISSYSKLIYKCIDGILIDI